MRSIESALFLINPNRFPNYARKLKRILKYYHAPHLRECRDADEFRRSVEDFAAGDLRYLLIWGGDGTANLAINSFMQAPEAKREGKALGFLRGGSGNGIQDSYEVPRPLLKQVKAYLEGMEKGYLQPVDLIRIDDGRSSRFAQLAGVGIDAQVLIHREGAGRGRPGLGNYIRAVLKAWWSDFDELRVQKEVVMSRGKYAFKGTRTNAEFPFEEFIRSTRSPLIEIATRPYYAKMFKIAPDVVCNDGVLDIYSYNFHRRREFLFNLMGIWNGWHSRINRLQARRERPVIERYEVEEAVIEGRDPFAYHLDGELARCDRPDERGRYLLKTKIVPSSITFIVPGSFYRKFHPFDDDRSRSARLKNR